MGGVKFDNLGVGALGHVALGVGMDGMVNEDDGR